MQVTSELPKLESIVPQRLRWHSLPLTVLRMQALQRLFVLPLLGVLFVASCQEADRAQLNATKETKIEPDQAAATTYSAVVKRSTPTVVKYDTDPKALMRSFDTWYKYHYFTIKLAQDFIGLDTDSSIIDKGIFLKKLATGNFITVKVLEKNSAPYYKLFKLTSSDPTIKGTLQQLTTYEIEHVKLEGQELPKYNFTDLKGRNYNNTTSKGKIILFKCWFIGCGTCVAEFPELNKLVDEYKNQNDILFVSLASDNSKDLTTFLSKKEFKYAVIPDAKDYMSNKLHVSMYPTHILIGKDGKIRKVTNKIEDIIPFIKQL